MKKIIILFFLFPVIVSGQIITTVAGGGTGGLGDGGAATDATFGGPVAGIALDKYGNIYIADWYNNLVRKVTISTGIITSIAGTSIAGYNGDSIPATSAQLYGPKYVAVDKFDNVYIAESVNQRVRKVDTNGIITTYAGNGYGAGTSSGGFSGDSGQATAAELNDPNGLCLDTNSNLYICDAQNWRIRKVDFITHIINTVVGHGGGAFGGDGGPATAAIFGCNVVDICFDSINNMYISGDAGSERVRKINAITQIINTVAGNGVGVYSSDGVLATTTSMCPISVVIDKWRNLFISDYINHRIRKVDVSTGIINTICGTGVAGYSGDSGFADTAKIYRPAHLVFDQCGNLYFSDANNLRIRKVTFDSTCSLATLKTTNITGSSELNLYPNPANYTLSISYSEAINSVVVYDMVGEIVIDNKYNSINSVDIDVRRLKRGVYVVRVNGGEVRRFVVSES